MLNLSILLLLILLIIIIYFIFNETFINFDNTINDNTINDNTINNNAINDNTINNNAINDNTINDNTINNNTIGFIILRHVNNVLTNKYWIYSYHCIRNFYPENFIIIIDDNSNYEYITDEKLYKTKIINSEFPKRGELLPYYYFLKNKLFDTAVILHDSVFINTYIDFNVDKYKMIWTFEHYWDQIEDETKMIKSFNNVELLNFYKNKNLWNGCFGGMTIITYDYLNYINNKYDLSKLLNHITTRYNRCSFERVIGCLLQKEYKTKPLFKYIYNYMPWGITFDQKDDYNYLPLVKVWTGR